ncbi:MAG: sigma-54-dependent transcriptional regulator, partial [Acidobacteriota bacterium]
LVEDEEEVRAALADLLRAGGHVVIEASAGARALDLLRASAVDAVLLDLGLPDRDGQDLIPEMRAIDDLVPVVVLTGRGAIETVVEAMKRGADNFLVKPADSSTVLAAVNRSLAEGRQRRRAVTALAELGRRGAKVPVGSSQAMRRALDLAARVAVTDSSVVLIGESGSGKGMLAQLIHGLSRRSNGPFLDLNCAALPAQLLESELFGHERGAFTDARDAKMGLLEVANHGTLFLDEIAEMDLAVQSKLLKALEDRRFRRLGGVRETTVDVRVVVASQQDLKAAVDSGRFRADLYYRLNVFRIDLPPLRSRSEDTLEIAMSFVAELNPVLGRRVSRISERAGQVLTAYAWPGNVRELRNVVERAMILATGEVLGVEHLSVDLRRRTDAERLQTLAEVEAAHIREVLGACGGNVSRAAVLLGVARSTLYEKLRDHGIVVPRERGEGVGGTLRGSRS